MELCLLKSDALDTLKNSLPQIYDKYLTERDNSWVSEVCGCGNPFVKFRDVEDFELAPLDKGLDAGEIDFRNCKTLCRNLSFLTPRQAADEKFWAGLCHGVFYDYVRRRWNYDAEDSADEDIVNKIKNRFFFNGGARIHLVTNTLSKYWWAGRVFNDGKLDLLGAKDFYTKIFSIMTRAFIVSENVLNGFSKFLKHFADRGTPLDIRKHIRPAMSELNRQGGAVILDCLTEEEIAAIMIEYVDKTFAVQTSADTSRLADTRTVKTGSIVKVMSLDNGKKRVYKISDTFK